MFDAAQVKKPQQQIGKRNKKEWSNFLPAKSVSKENFKDQGGQKEEFKGKPDDIFDYPRDILPN